MPASRFQLRIRNAILDDRILTLHEDGAIVGRGDAAAIRLEDSTISRFHARLEPALNHVLVTDLDSSNGTFVDEVRITAPCAARAGQQLRFGAVRCELIDAQPVASNSTVGGATQNLIPPHKSGLRIAGLCLGIAALAVAVTYEVFAPTDLENTDPRTDPQKAPLIHETTPAERPPEIAVRPDELGPTDPVVEAETPTEEVLKPPQATVTNKVVVRDGAVHEGELMPSDDCEVLLLRPHAGGPPERLDSETVVSIDGRTFTADFSAIYKARAARARNPTALRELMRWCDEHKLVAEQRQSAEALTRLQPDAHDAWAVLGRCRVRGELLDLAAVRKLGLLDAKDRLLGPPDACRAVTALYLDLLQRPPMPEELSDALHVTEDVALAAILGSTECARARLAQLAEPLGIGDPPAELVADLANGALSTSAAMHRLAEAAVAASADKQATAVALLRMYLPAPQCDDADLRIAAARMLGGERVALFGDRGASSSDLLGILARQPGFFRRLVESEARRCLGSSLDADSTRKAIFRVAADPSALAALRREWISSPLRKNSAVRVMSAEQAAASTIVYGLERLPATGEAAKLASELHAIAGEGSATLLALLLPLHVPPDETAWNDFLKRCRQRPASEAELALFRATPAEQRAALVAAVLHTQVSESYGP